MGKRSNKEDTGFKRIGLNGLEILKSYMSTDFIVSRS